MADNSQIMIFLLSIIQLANSLELFIVPHSHCDLGWLHTIDWYYQNKVKSIFHTITTLLAEDKDRKIVWSETSYLKMWMEGQDLEMQEAMKSLIKNGQIEIVGGGYVQNDEANTDFDMVIRQIEHGHEYLNEKFGINKVKVGWQIDPFGHSALTPSLWAKFGYQYHVINRIDSSFKQELINNGNLEFIWYGVDFGKNESIFTHVLYDHYDAPPILNIYSPQYCFSNGTLSVEILKICAEKLFSLVVQRTSAYRTDKMMFLYGDDFYFSDLDSSRTEFKNLEALIDYINRSPNYYGFTVKIATASEYFDAVWSSNKKFSRYLSDFLPYRNFRGDVLSVYWTGLYTTRPALKEIIYETHRIARAAEIAKTVCKKERFSAYQASLTLHHDSITGTCRPDVSHDYKLRDKSDINLAFEAISSVIKSQINWPSTNNFTINLPYRVIIAFNSLNWDKTALLNITLKGKIYIEIKDWNGNAVKSQLVEDSFNGGFIVYFKAVLPSLSFVTFFITEHEKPCEGCSVESETKKSKKLADSCYKLKFNKLGMIKNIESSKFKYDLVQKFWQYSGKNSGAYIFRPIDEGKELKDLKLEKFIISEGPIVKVAEVIWKRKSKFFSEKIILYDEKKFSLEIGLFARKNEEIMIRFSSKNIKNSPWLFTSNSGDLRSRVYYTEPYTEKGNNMYPAPGGFAVKLEKEFLKIFPLFSIGVEMVNANTFELLIHRSLTHDDGFGLDMGVIDKTFVNHHFDIELNENLDSQYWKSSFESKTKVYSFPVMTDEGDVSMEEWHNGKEMASNWKIRTYYEMGFNNPNVYLSSAVMKGEETIFRILNFNSKEEPIWIEKFEMGRKMLFDGYEEESKQKNWEEDEKEIAYTSKPDSGKPIRSLNATRSEIKDGIVLAPLEFAALNASARIN
ncbi:MAN2A2_7 [Blepharisma stoltei]|uniref:Alpha-mannosidase n=1 Tax=Blepharisma stoltei TaxID=1481888 RepID=A0AAU9JEW6_9CILI|nr:unnamed protein product [Blepharisma stoltei]